MGLTRGQYSISDLLEMDAKGKKSVIPYICLVETEGGDDFLQSCKYEFLYEKGRIADFLSWTKRKRKTLFVLQQVLNERLQEDLEDTKDSLTVTMETIIYYYLVNVEKKINTRVKLNMPEDGIVSLLQAKSGNIRAALRRDVYNLFPDQYLTQMTERLLSKYEYEERLKLVVDVPESFSSFEMMLHDYVFVNALDVQDKVSDSALEDKEVLNKKLEKELSELKSKVKSFEEKQRIKDVNQLQYETKCKEQENQISLLEEELLVMQNKLTSLEDRNRILSLTVTQEDVALNEQLIEEENEIIDLSKYNIVICGNGRHLKKYSYKILDYYSGPQRITMLDKADVIAIITTDIEHAAYWAIKSYCRTHGLKFCNINGNTPRIVESGLKNFVRENLL